MDFLLDNSQSARIKWLGRYYGHSGKSMYLSKTVPERSEPSRPSVKTEDREGFAAFGIVQPGGKDQTRSSGEEQRKSVCPGIRFHRNGFFPK
jgi:hypothetical protein